MIVRVVVLVVYVRSMGYTSMFRIFKVGVWRRSGEGVRRGFGLKRSAL